MPIELVYGLKMVEISCAYCGFRFRISENLADSGKPIYCSDFHKEQAIMKRSGKRYEHGTNTCYVNLRCRCEACSQAAMEYQKQWRYQKTKRII